MESTCFREGQIVSVLFLANNQEYEFYFYIPRYKIYNT